MRLLDLPADIVGEVARRLPAVEDVLRLQQTHPRLRSQLDAVFWSCPTTLLLGTATRPALVLADDDTTLSFTSDRPRAWVEVVLAKCRHLKELFLGRQAALMDRHLLALLTALEGSNCLQKLVVVYKEPESVYRGDKGASSWPSRCVHDRLCALVRASPDLCFFGLGLEHNDDFVSASRLSPVDPVLQVEYNHRDSWESRVHVFHRFLGAFAAGQRVRELRVLARTCPSRAQLVLDVCVHSCVQGADPRVSGFLERVFVRVSVLDEEQNEAPQAFESFHNLPGLKSIAWSFDLPLPEEVLVKLCRPERPRAHEVLVQTPRLRKTFPSTGARDAASVQLLSCPS